MQVGSIDIVIPVYQEDKNIELAIRRIYSAVKVPYSLYLVYDFDEDSTLPVAKRVGLEIGIPIHFIKNQFGGGALNAIKTGLLSTHSDYVVVTMADLSDPPEVINQMFELAEVRQMDVVCGSRYMKGGSQIGGPLLKRTLSKLACLTLHYLARIPTHDATNSFKLYRRSFLNSIEIESTGGFEIGLEIVVKAFVKKGKIGEIPTSWEDRSAGESRFKMFKWIPKYLKWYFYAYSSE